MRYLLFLRDFELQTVYVQGTVEEKIVERADKLYLMRCCGQARQQQKSATVEVRYRCLSVCLSLPLILTCLCVSVCAVLDRDEMKSMLSWGASRVLNSEPCATMTDEDIDALLAKVRSLTDYMLLFILALWMCFLWGF